MEVVEADEAIEDEVDVAQRDVQVEAEGKSFIN